jgi:hypothetical protein
LTVSMKALVTSPTFVRTLEPFPVEDRIGT